MKPESDADQSIPEPTPSPQDNIAELKPKKVASPFDDLSQLVDEKINEPVAERLLTVIKVQKPPKGVFFRAHPDKAYQPQMWGYVPDRATGIEGNFVVTREMTPYFGNLANPYTFVLCVTEQGQLFIWPVRFIREGEQRNPWWVTGRQALELAEKRWIRLEASMGKGHYDIYRSKKPPEDETVPEWPDQPIGELLRIAFGEDGVVNSLDHWVIKKLSGL